MEYEQLKLIEKSVKIPSGCGVAGIINKNAIRFSPDTIISSICMMKERGNGLGSGYAGYGIYPELRDKWCLHIMYDKPGEKENVEEFLETGFNIVEQQPIPVKKSKRLPFVPVLYRYFLDVKNEVSTNVSSEEDFILETVMKINRNFDGACVFSSGKNMGIFKGVGHPDEIAEFYNIHNYKGYTWIAHNRFPTNTVGWWGGAHPFGILDWACVHNGEISSYGINRRYLENAGYYCTFYTDTEVITYLFDLLCRRHKLNFEMCSYVLAPPFWEEIERETDVKKKKLMKFLRIIYASAMLNGPFAIIVANSSVLIGMNDRLKLRPLVAASKDDFVFVASEESAIRKICPHPERVWMPEAGKPIIVHLQENKNYGEIKKYK
ncbi:MAG: glutamine amidotransferase family protein [Candidatus Omnitrophica bacterium]|nr:glutamine amidotransferase family protein [Candidatus Omnitrophota bacterium]